MIIRMTRNKKTEFTRMCIAEAITSMLDRTSLEKMKVSDIVKRAGVARMTFYKYYTRPYDALTDYLDIIISQYIQENEAEPTKAAYMEEEHIRCAMEFFDRYADFFLALQRHGLYSIMIEGVNGFMEQHVQTEKKLSVYELYSYAGGLLNTFLQWEAGGKKDSAAEVAAVISRRYEVKGVGSPNASDV